MDSTSRTVRADDGRELRIIEAGPPDGLPVLVQHGTPSCRLLFDPWIADATAQGLRLIGYDRPGYGGSTPQPGRAVADAAADVRAIAEALGIRRLCTWGVSGGGPHTLACAALLPDLVAAAAVLSVAQSLAYGILPNSGLRTAPAITIQSTTTTTIGGRRSKIVPHTITATARATGNAINATNRTPRIHTPMKANMCYLRRRFVSRSIP